MDQSIGCLFVRFNASVFFWGYVKSLVYANKLTKLEELKANIEREIARFGRNVLPVMENGPNNRPLQRARGGHMSEVEFHL
ncbi:hypothetical protein TNIN_76631 [Trichonephila inaurata madagascariensis]|uniref:Uncharacterized protein n=1 Tax=Trichonephila inaurata madagascariensis TaxID=2747483 RepID=A0A8X6J2W1_9ARAC|nr:hypothetical protein TNIN_76631 [Trichonephila inaurata madagascariensis]